MILFALCSIPLIYTILDEQISYKKITHYFSGIIISSIISIIFWSISTLYKYNSHTLLLITIDELIEVYIPLQILFLYIFICKLRNSKCMLTMDFIMGYIHWNLLFSLLSNVRSFYFFQELYLPIFYMMGIYLFFNLSKVNFLKNDIVVKRVIIILFPLYLFIIHVLKNAGLIGVSVWFILHLGLYIILKRDLWSLKQKIFL